jgi:hypothetical protein
MACSRSGAPTAPGTSSNSATGRSTSSNDWTGRSRSAATGSIRARSRTRCAGSIEAHDGSAGGDPDALVCYYTGEADSRSVRKHLESVLDPYKIPSVLERVGALPYTPNGKVDRDALQADRRAPTALNSTALNSTALDNTALDNTAADEPASPGLRVLHLARTLTGVSDVGLDDNFFEVGGDSASAVVLVSKMKELGWVDAGVRDVLRAENLRVLADRLQERSV